MATKEIVFITGANTGIGYEIAKALFQSPKPYHVLLGSRSAEKGVNAVEQLATDVPESASTVETVQIDVTDDQSINKAVSFTKDRFGKLDVLVNNAGAAFDTTFDGDAGNYRELMNKSYDVNVTGAQVLTYAMAPLLLQASSPRLIFLTSGTAPLIGNAKALIPTWAPRPGAGWPKENLFTAQAYRTSKVAINLLMLTWYWLLKEDGVKTWSVSPGFLATNLNGSRERLQKMGAGDPSLGGQLIKAVIEGERDADVGKVVAQNGAIQDW